MRISEIKNLELVYVFKGEEKIGTLARTDNGSEFTYDNNYLTKTTDTKESLRAIAYTMPSRQTTYLTRGENLGAYFAGLLPEGFRLQALIRTVKTSADDLFSLLAASGSELIGDIAVSPTAELEKNKLTSLDRVELGKSIFLDIFNKSIEGDEFKQRIIDPSVPGVQAKISASMITFPVGIKNRHQQYILKLAPAEYPQLIENEHFFMRMAKDCGLSAARTKIVYDKKKTPGLLVERFDRYYNKEKKEIIKIHQEDACQFLNRYPQDKYRLDCRSIGRGMHEFCSAPIIEISKFLQLTAFSYIIVNGDLHAKNISLQTDPESARIVFSPAYDLLSSLPYGDDHMALQFEGKTDNLTTNMFIQFAESFGIRKAAIISMLKHLTLNTLPWLERLDEIGLSEKKTLHLKKTMLKRIKDLS
ncbi:MAG: HipA domain-containing protein [bacterium]|nr:HipA domain-containing protein [bacterium]